MRYGVALLLGFGVLALVRLLNGTLSGVRLSILVGATGIAAFVGGRGPGALTVAVSVLGLDLLFYEASSSHPVAFTRPVELGRLAVFTAVELLAMYGGAALRQALMLLDAERAQAHAGEQRFRLLAEDAQDIVYRFRRVPTPMFEYVSSATTRLLGFTPEEHYADPELWTKYIEPEDQRRVLDVEALTKGQPVVMRMLRKGGGVVWLEHRASALRNERGEIVAVQGIARDVTSQKRAEQAEALLLEASQLLAESLDARVTVGNVARLAARAGYCDVCTLVKATEGQGYEAPGYIVEAAVQSGGCRAEREQVEQFALRTANQAGLRHTGQLPRELDEAARALGLGSVLMLPLTSRRGPVGTMTFGLLGPRSFDAFDRGVADRLASRCAMALENAELLARAQRAVRQRDDVLAIVSHDLKNPLGAIMLAAGLIERSARGQEPLRRIEVNAQTIRRAAERMSRLIHDLLDFSALDAGKLTFDWRIFNAGSLLRDTLDTFAAPAHERMVNLELVPSAETLYLRADRDRIVQVLSNLLGNALQATPPHGTIWLSARAVAGSVHLAVRDTGKGIAPEELPHVFERFRRGTTGSKGGTGLGLAIVRALVEAHGGRVWAESTVGEGTTVTLALPRAEPPSAPAQV